jgi:hypothetical protein
MSTTAIAFLFAYRRRIALHRQWMTRSYAVNYHDIRVTLFARVPQRPVLPVEPGLAVDAPSLQR